MAESLQVALVTPEAKVFEGPAQSVVLPAHDGQMGFLPGRAPLLCKLGSGPMTVRTEAGETVFYVSGGFAQVRGSSLTVLATEALPRAELTRDAARSQLSDAQSLPNLSEVEHSRRQERIAAAQAKLALAQK